MTDDAKRGGYPGSGDGTTMGPPPPTPSGYFEAVPVPPDGYVPGEFREFIGPPLEALSEVKVIALTKAVELVGANGIPDPGEGGSETSEIIAIAKQFEAYLLGKETP